MLKQNSLAERAAALLLVAAIIICSLCGCGAEAVKEQPENAVTFTDALGRQVSVRKNPGRVAALLGSFAEIWMLAGGTVCATTDDAAEDYGLELDGAVNIGGAHSPSLEKILSSSPDFILASASTSADTEFCTTFEKAGITVAYFDVDNFDSYLEMLRICTEITERSDLYERNGLRLKEKIESLKKDFTLSGINENEKSVLLIRASSGLIKAKGGKGTILGEMLSNIGCSNIADSDKTLLENLSIESIILNEPYRIFVVTMGDDTEKALENLRRMMKENPAWGKLEAVKNNRIHIMDKSLFNLKPNGRWAEAYEKLIEVFLGK